MNAPKLFSVLETIGILCILGPRKFGQGKLGEKLTCGGRCPAFIDLARGTVGKDDSAIALVEAGVKISPFAKVRL